MAASACRARVRPSIIAWCLAGPAYVIWTPVRMMRWRRHGGTTAHDSFVLVNIVVRPFWILAILPIPTTGIIVVVVVRLLIGPLSFVVVSLARPALILY